MKSFLVLVFLFLSILISPVFSKHNVGFHPKARKISENIYSMGTTDWNGYKNVQTIAFVKTIEGSQSYGLYPEMKGFTELSCCSFIAPGSKWREPATFLVDPTNPQGLSNTFVMNAITGATTAWDDAVSFNIYGSITQQIFGETPSVTSPDGQNVKLFADLNDIGGLNPNSVIAVTFLHGIFGGNSLTNEILEADVVYNTVFVYGNGNSNSGVMDLQAIAAHEEGHVCGLGHTDTSLSCAENTMFPTAVYGETKKRTPEEDDITCIRTLYLEPGFDLPPNFASAASKTEIAGMTTMIVLLISLFLN